MLYVARLDFVRKPQLEILEQHAQTAGIELTIKNESENAAYVLVALDNQLTKEKMEQLGELLDREVIKAGKLPINLPTVHVVDEKDPVDTLASLQTAIAKLGSIPPALRSELCRTVSNARDHLENQRQK